MVVGIFWDIENCPLPSGADASECIERIRVLVGVRSGRGRETNFCAFLKSKDYPDSFLSRLQLAGVTLIHVASRKQGAADGLLLDQLDKFRASHSPPGLCACPYYFFVLDILC